MNRSYSKIRHMQESNQRLENRLLTEDTEGVESSINPCQALSACKGKTYKVTSTKRLNDLVIQLLSGSGISGYGNIAKWSQINDTNKYIPNESIGLVPSKDFPISAGSKFAFVFNLKGKKHLTLWLDTRCNDSCPLIHYDSIGDGKSSVPFHIMNDAEYVKLLTTLKQDITNVKS